LERYDEGYKNVKMYDGIVQTIAMLAVVGAFAIMYNRNNPQIESDRTDIPRRPTIEAILNKEEKSFILPEVKDPGNKKKSYDRHSIEPRLYK